MSVVGNIIEFWGENDELSDLDVEEAQRVLASWMAKLPGDVWDYRLGDPPSKK